VTQKKWRDCSSTADGLVLRVRKKKGSGKARATTVTRMIKAAVDGEERMEERMPTCKGVCDRR
jgi:hypothetical protein